MDSYLIGIHGVGRKEETPLHPIAITKDMKQLVYKNFDLINDFKVDFRAFHGQDEVGVTVKDIVLGNSIKDILLGNFEEIFDKVSQCSTLY